MENSELVFTRDENTATKIRNFKRLSAMTSDGVKISFVEAGNLSGPPIIFVHGISQSWRSWEKQLSNPSLGEKFRLIAIDLRGHGDSQGAQGAVDIDGRSLPPLTPDKYNDGTPEGTARLWASDIAAVIASRGLSYVTLVGWSYGGAVVLDYLFTTRDFGLVNKAVLLATTPVIRPPGTADGGADQVFTERAIGALMHTIPVNPSASPPRENEPSEINRGLGEFVTACAADDSERAPASDCEIEPIVSFNLSTEPTVRMSIIARSFDYRPFLAQLPSEIQKNIKIITPLGDKVLQVSNTRTYWPSSSMEHHIVNAEGHLYFWRNPEDFHERLMSFIG